MRYGPACNGSTRSSGGVVEEGGAGVSAVFIKAGDTVTAGQQIGKMSNTGYSYGCHLHFQIEKDGKPINPEPFMQTAGAPLPH